MINNKLDKKGNCKGLKKNKKNKYFRQLNVGLLRSANRDRDMTYTMYTYLPVQKKIYKLGEGKEGNVRSWF